MVDIIILAILIVMAFLGYKKGFFKGLTGLVSIVVSFAVAICFFSQVADFLKTTPVYETIYNNIEKSIVSSENNSNAEIAEKSLNIPDTLIENIEESAQEVRDEMFLTVAEKIADLAIKMLSAFIVFIIARVIVWIVMTFLGIVKKLPLIGWFDRLLGAVLGFVRGFFVVYILLLLVAIGATFNSENLVAKKVNQSEFAKAMYNNNVFLDFIYKD